MIEGERAMFEKVFDNLRTATEASVQAQQDIFQKWISLWPGAPSSPYAWGEKVQKVQKKWNQIVAEQVKKQREVLEAQFSAGLRNLEESFRLAEAKDPEEFRINTLELWSKSFDYLRQTAEAQLREFQVATEKWVDMVAKNETACGV
jgi:hypothetical protein